jgi:hypothetical protein
MTDTYTSFYSFLMPQFKYSPRGYGGGLVVGDDAIPITVSSTIPWPAAIWAFVSMCTDIYKLPESFSQQLFSYFRRYSLAIFSPVLFPDAYTVTAFAHFAITVAAVIGKHR